MSNNEKTASVVDYSVTQQWKHYNFQNEAIREKRKGDCVRLCAFTCVCVCEGVSASVCVWTALAPGFCQEGVSVECYFFFFSQVHLKSSRASKAPPRSVFSMIRS